MTRTILDMCLGAVVYQGFVFIRELWLLRIRGEFHCPTCKHVSPLPKDEDE